MSQYVLQREVNGAFITITYGYHSFFLWFYREEHPGQEKPVVDLCFLLDDLLGQDIAERLVGSEEAVIAIMTGKADPPPDVPFERLRNMVFETPI